MQRNSFLTSLGKLSNVEDNEIKVGETNMKLGKRTKIEEIKQFYEKEIKKLELNYQEVQKNKEIEKEAFIQDVERNLNEKENLIEKLTKENSEFILEIKKFKSIVYDGEREKDDLLLTIEQLGNDLEELKKSMEIEVNDN